MRPTDENQYSTRPNLMSSGTRRSSGEENILAMLERNERGRLAAAPRIAWYLSAGVLGLVLVSCLAWLLHENQANNEALRVVEQSAVVAVPDPPLAPAAAAEHADGGPGRAATIVDAREPAAAAAPAMVLAQAARQEPPPLVLLSAKEAGAARAAPPIQEAAERAQPVREAAAPPKATARPKAASAAGLADKPAARPSKGVRAKKLQPSVPANTGEAPADTDVALISAIISHSSRHANDTACGTAGDKKCAPRRPAQP